MWSAPSYYVGAGAAALAAWTINRVGFWPAPLMFAPVYLTYRTYRMYVGRFEAQRHVQETSDLHLATIEALAAAIDAKDQMTRVHIRRVQAYAAGLAEAVKLSPGEIQAVRTAALLHDIGKLAIPDAVLLKPASLDPDEWGLMQSHAVMGSQMASRIPNLSQSALQVIRHHHERWDGMGYPDHLCGETIPLVARIFAVCDVYDTLLSKRAYSKPWSAHAALEELRTQSGKQFDPKVIEAFFELAIGSPTMVKTLEQPDL